MIAIACDHTAVALKEELKQLLSDLGEETIDCGTDSSDVLVDYPLYALRVCNLILQQKAERGIVLCGTGIGMSIACNKVDGIRCVVCSEEYSAQMSREHNDANVLAMGARVVDSEKAKRIVRIWLETSFADPLGRHQPRLDQLRSIEQDQGARLLY